MLNFICPFIVTFSLLAHIYNHCGGTLKNSSGYISPPDLDTDGYYDFNLYCFWHIQVNTNASIIYQFMYIAIEDMASGCNTDYLHVSAFHHFNTSKKVCKDQELKQSEPKSSPQNPNGE